MTPQERESYMELLALAKRYNPTSPASVRYKGRVMIRAYAVLQEGRKRGWLDKVRGICSKRPNSL